MMLQNMLYKNHAKIKEDCKRALYLHNDLMIIYIYEFEGLFTAMHVLSYMHIICWLK